MTRIIGGRAGGRRLATPDGVNTRPTSDRVREALFSAIEAWCGTWHELRVLDLYAGSGAIGLEAWSRGAQRVTLVESDRRAAALISSNAKSLACEVAQVVTASVGAYLRKPATSDFDIVYLDPPYPLPLAEVEQNLADLLGYGWLRADALVVVERGSRERELHWPAGLEPYREKKYGETRLFYATGPTADDAEADGAKMGE